MCSASVRSGVNGGSYSPEAVAFIIDLLRINLVATLYPLSDAVRYKVEPYDAGSDDFSETVLYTPLLIPFMTPRTEI